jgi:photosystem II stability/assembly factor-like uncharacterized protein
VDAGLNWTVGRLSTSRNLTTVLGDHHGLAVAAGHGGALFRSTDEGLNWAAVPEAEIERVNPDREPILCGLIDHRGAIRLGGAFGLLIESDDGGMSWRRSAPVAADFDRHVYGIFESTDGVTRWLVGESGTLAWRAPGQNWNLLESPYTGSFFGGLTTPGDATLVFGMRGVIYRRAKGENRWRQCPCPDPIAWMAGRVLGGRRIVLVGDQGWIAVSDDDGFSVNLHRVADASLSDLIAHRDGAISLAGIQGLMRRERLPARIETRLPAGRESR